MEEFVPEPTALTSCDWDDKSGPIMDVTWSC